MICASARQNFDGDAVASSRNFNDGAKQVVCEFNFWPDRALDLLKLSAQFMFCCNYYVCGGPVFSCPHISGFASPILQKTCLTASAAHHSYIFLSDHTRHITPDCNHTLNSYNYTINFQKMVVFCLFYYYFFLQNMIVYNFYS